jgi:hypothetical protein
MFRPKWPSSSVKTPDVRKLLCIFGLVLVRSHLHVAELSMMGRCPPVACALLWLRILQLNFVAFVRERNIRTMQPPLVGKLVPTFADRWCHVVSATDLCGRILGLLDRSRYSFFQVAPQLYTRGWVDPISHPPLTKLKLTKHRGLSLLANYTHRATSVCRKVSASFCG